MDPRNSVKSAYDLIGPDFGKKRTEPWDFVIEWLKSFQSKNFEKPLKLLVAGCGNGRHVRLASELEFDVSGIDISPNMVNATIQAEIELGRLDPKIQVSDVCDLPFLDGEFDMVMCIAVLHHLPFNLNKIAMDEFSRVIRTNGNLLISCWDPSAPSVVNGKNDEKEEDVVWVSWMLPDTSLVSRYYHLPEIQSRNENWNEINGLICNRFELQNFNQLFYFTKE